MFEPGTRYSYANTNFRLLGDLVSARAGRGLGELLRRHIFDRAGMSTAFLGEDTRSLPDGTLGYEGSPELGFRPAVNRVVWTGDAGIVASLKDMIAWEAFIDATRENADGLYRRLAVPPTFRDGEPAFYGLGLGRESLFGRAVTGHAGALRGWRSYRLHAAAERLSVVVLFNHMADPRDAASELFGAVLGEPEPAHDLERPDPYGTAPLPQGAFLEPETGLVVRLEAAGRKVRLHYNTVPELIDPASPAEPDSGGARLQRTPDGLWMDRPADHQRSRLIPLGPPGARDVEARYRCVELASELLVTSSGGVLYGAFSGDLGQGEMQPLLPVGDDVWRLPCPRALDYHAPGDWTVAFHRDDAGQVNGARVGCWLARGIEYVRM